MKIRVKNLALVIVLSLLVVAGIFTFRLPTAAASGAVTATVEEADDIGKWGREIKLEELESTGWGVNLPSVTRKIENEKFVATMQADGSALYSFGISVNFDKSPYIEMDVESISGSNLWFLYLYTEGLATNLEYTKTASRDVGKVKFNVGANLTGTQRVSLYLGFSGVVANDTFVINSMKTGYGKAWGDEIANSDILSWTKTGVAAIADDGGKVKISGTAAGSTAFSSAKTYIDLSANPFIEIDMQSITNVGAATEYAYWSADIQYADNSLETVQVNSTTAGKVIFYPTGDAKLGADDKAHKGGQKILLNLRVGKVGDTAFTVLLNGIKTGYVQNYQSTVSLAGIAEYALTNATVTAAEDNVKIAAKAGGGSILSPIMAIDLNLGNTIIINASQITAGAKWSLSAVYSDGREEVLQAATNAVGTKKYELTGKKTSDGTAAALSGKQKLQLKIAVDTAGTLIVNEFKADYVQLWGENTLNKDVAKWTATGATAAVLESGKLGITQAAESAGATLKSDSYSIDVSKSAYLESDFSALVNCTYKIKLVYGDGTVETLTPTVGLGNNKFEIKGSDTVKGKTKVNIIIELTRTAAGAYSAQLNTLKAGNVASWNSAIDVFEVSRMWKSEGMTVGMSGGDMSVKAVMQDTNTGSIVSGIMLVDLDKPAKIVLDVTKVTSCNYSIVALVENKTTGKTENVTLKGGMTSSGEIKTSAISEHCNARGENFVKIQLWVTGLAEDNELLIGGISTLYEDNSAVTKLSKPSGTQSISGNIFFVLQDDLVKDITYKVLDTTGKVIIAPFTSTKLYYDFSNVKELTAGKYKLIIKANPKNTAIAASDEAEFEIYKKEYLALSAITIEGTKIKWTAVDNATSYKLYVKQREVILEETRPSSTVLEFDASHLVAGLYRVEVEALGDGKAWINSKSSAMFTSTYVPAQFVKVTFNSDGNNVKRETIALGSTVTSYAITREGYTFDGWYLSADGGKTLSETSFDFSGAVNADITLYAKWTKNAENKADGCGGCGTVALGGGALGGGLTGGSITGIIVSAAFAALLCAAAILILKRNKGEVK